MIVLKFSMGLSVIYIFFCNLTCFYLPGKLVVFHIFHFNRPELKPVVAEPEVVLRYMLVNKFDLLLNNIVLWPY